MSTTQAQKIVLAARPLGKPRLADFRLEETTMPAPGPGQVLLRVQYLSLDPYMRGRMDDRESYALPTPLGGVMPGESVATVIATRHPGYSKGDTVLAGTGWCTHTLSDRGDLRKLDPAVAPVTTGLGVLGMPGFTAYGGLRVIGKPAPGETVVVAAASGPVGSLVGQLAKIAGATAVGIAGGPEKCAFLKDELGFDAAVDHKAVDFAARLKEACPKGIDVYYENVGGAVWQASCPKASWFEALSTTSLMPHTLPPSCGRSALASPTAASAIAKTSSMGWRRRRSRRPTPRPHTRPSVRQGTVELGRGLCDSHLR